MGLKWCRSGVKMGEFLLVGRTAFCWFGIPSCQFPKRARGTCPYTAPVGHALKSHGTLIPTSCGGYVESLKNACDINVVKTVAPLCIQLSWHWSCEFLACGIGLVPRSAFLIAVMRFVTCKILQGHKQNSEYVASEMLVRLPPFPWLSKAENGCRATIQLFLFFLLSLVASLDQWDWLRACCFV